MYNLNKYVTIKYNYNIIQPVKSSVTGTMIDDGTDMCVNNVNKKRAKVSNSKNVYRNNSWKRHTYGYYIDRIL